MFGWMRKPLEAKASRVGGILFTGGGEPVWSSRDYAAFAREAYKQNVVAFQAINKIADAMGGIDWEVWKGDTVLDAHPLIDLFARPNPQQSLAELMKAKVGYLMLSGNNYDERILAGKHIKELYTHRPDRMKVIPGKTGIPKRFEYSVGGRKETWDVDEDTGVGDLRQNKTFNPLDDWYGMAPVEAAAWAVDQHNESMSWLQALLQNSARPSGALTSEGDLGDEQFARLKAMIEEQYSGGKNAGRPMLLEGGLDWKAMGLSPTDMGIIEAKNSAARDISLALGVPPQMIGIPGDNTYANYAEARLSFWEETVIPLANFFADDWTSWFGEVYPDISIRIDMDAIPAIAEKRMQMWDMADKSMDLTIDETRVMKGFDPLGDEKGGKLKGELRQQPKAEPLGADALKALAYGAS